MDRDSYDASKEPIRVPRRCNPVVVTASSDATLAALTAEERAALAELRQAMQEFLAKDDEDVEIPRDLAKGWLDDWCLLRYLRARSFKVDAARDMLVATLRFRTDRGLWDMARGTIPDEMMASLKLEGHTGKTYVHGRDRAGRPVIYMRDRRQNTKTYAEQVQFTIFTLELACQLMPSPSVEKYVLVIDFRGQTMSNKPPMSVAREVLTVFQSHLPERLFVAYFIDAPWLFWAFWRVISGFVDEVTKAKVIFCNPSKGDPEEIAKLTRNIAPDQLESPFGGDLECRYDPEIYWESVLQELRSTPDTSSSNSSSALKKKKKKKRK